MNMPEVKKRRASKARTLTRRIKAWNNAITDHIAKEDIHEKIHAAKYNFEELGSIQDEVIELIQDDDYDRKKLWRPTLNGTKNMKRKSIMQSREHGSILHQLK